MTVIHRNSLILRRHARAMREHADQLRNVAAKGAIVPMPAALLLGLAQTLEVAGNDMARTSDAVSALETLLQSAEEKPVS
jgi:hypothetical protein